jgi:hypothetical protein
MSKTKFIPPWAQPPKQHTRDSTDPLVTAAFAFIKAAYSKEFISRITRIEEVFQKQKKTGYTKIEFILRSGNCLKVCTDGTNISFGSSIYKKNRLTKNGQWKGTVSDLNNGRQVSNECP